MKEESSLGQSNSRLMAASRSAFNKKNQSKLSQYQTNFDNYAKNQQFNHSIMDPKGVAAIGIYGSFSGTIEKIRLFSNSNQTLQCSYKVCLGEQWYDETPQTDDTEGVSNFCESRSGKAVISLGFDCLVSCMFISSWPKLLITVKGFNFKGQLVPKGYAYIDLPSETGQFVKKAHIYSIIRNQSWYHRWLPFFEVQPSALDDKQIERVIIRGQGRQSQKTRCIGIISIRVETLLRNFQRFGYK